MSLGNRCEQCQKNERLCVCSILRPQLTQLQVLILQHPQEPREALSSARLAHLALKNSTLKIGLSWPNLKMALGKEGVPPRWAVLYLGSGVSGEKSNQTIQFVDKKGKLAAPPSALDGVVILDGTWTQAKALWWRNPWLLKLKRMILQPSSPSLYRELRREPRKECLSTIESLAETLVALGEPKEVELHLKELFSALLQKHRGATS